MSVLINGMEMPPDCRVCPFEMYYINTGKTRCGAAMRTLAENFKTIPFVGRAEFCPLIELQPHGRLIDADALTTVTEMVNGEWKTYVEVFEIADAPTIIPAEGVYGQYTDIAGNYHWFGTRSGEHVIKA